MFTVPVPITNKAGGRWNTFEITAKGSDLSVKLNGIVTSRTQNTLFASGPFALQFGPGVKRRDRRTHQVAQGADQDFVGTSHCRFAEAMRTLV